MPRSSRSTSIITPKSITCMTMMEKLPGIIHILISMNRWTTTTRTPPISTPDMSDRYNYWIVLAPESLSTATSTL
jgi:hypothetical protein